MADMRLDRSGMEPAFGVSGIAEERPRPSQQEHGRRDEQDPDDGRGAGGREELAVALGETGRQLRAELEHDADGELLVRVVDVNRGEVVAILTPDELRSMAGATGLPSGLLFQARS